MRKLFFIILIISSLSSCRNKKSDCIKKSMDAGYSYEEAKEGCEDAQRDSQIRGRE